MYIVYKLKRLFWNVANGYCFPVVNDPDKSCLFLFKTDALHKLFEHLHNKGLAVQQPVHNVNGHTWSVETVPDENNLQRK